MTAWDCHRNYLGAGEVEVLSLRTHVKALFMPAVVLVLIAIVGAGVVRAPGQRPAVGHPG